MLSPLKVASALIHSYYLFVHQPPIYLTNPTNTDYVLLNSLTILKVIASISESMLPSNGHLETLLITYQIIVGQGISLNVGIDIVCFTPTIVPSYRH